MLARDHAGDGEFPEVEAIVIVTYAVTLVLSAPIHVALSRYTADRLYERRPAALAPLLRCTLAATMFGFLVVGIFAMPLFGAPLALACMVPALAALVGGQWLLLGVGGGLCSPAVVLRAFGAGTVVSIAGALALERAAALGARGFLYGFAGGQAVTMTSMLIGVLRALPEADAAADAAVPRTSPWAAFREHRVLAASAFLFHLSMWADKLMIWLLAGWAQAMTYANAAALAWFSVIPAFAWIYVEVETLFYRKFRDFYGALEGGAGLGELEIKAGALRRETARLLRGAAAIQLLMTALVLAASGPLVAALGLPPEAITPFRLIAVGAAPQVIAMLGMLLLYYFDLQHDAYVVSVANLTACIAMTAGAWALGLPPGVGLAIASLLSMANVLQLTNRRLQKLVVDTFQSQPCSAEHLH